MGDGGALLLGLLMAAATMVVGGRVDQNVQFSGQTYFFFAPLFIPLFILGRADPRHVPRDRAPGRQAHGRRRAPTRSTSTTASCASVTASAAAC